MKCDAVDRIVVLTIVLSIISSFLALFAELLSQKCEKKEEEKKRKAEDLRDKEIQELKKRISQLESKLDNA